MTVTLIGYRGSGKTSVAGPLAARLGWDWLDADAEIERRAGQTIREIFTTSGEAGFRSQERAVMACLLQQENLVLAAGGGAILNPETRKEMRAAGPVVWLRASPETLQDRIVADATTAARRPNLTAQSGVAEVRELLAQREPLYRECATVIISSDGRPVAEIVDEILQQLHLPGA